MKNKSLCVLNSCSKDYCRILMRGCPKCLFLMPGMEVTAEIKTGERRLIEYFLAPLLRHGSESLREG
jgi:hypothetical protein